MRQLLTERYRERLAGVLSCYHHRHAARSLLCEGNDGVSFCAADADLRLSAICRTAS
jgi:hypothetical protein